MPPKLAARVRLLQSGNTSKNDPNDAYSVAVAALRSKAWRPVVAEDHAVVLKIWAKRHRDLARARNQACCRLHAVLCDLVPGGIRREISAGKAARVLEQVTPSGPAAQARRELAAEFLAGLRRLDAQLREANTKLAAAVRASGTSPAIAAFSIAHHITGEAAWTAALVLMALADVLTRLAVVFPRGRRLTATTAPVIAASAPAGAGA